MKKRFGKPKNLGLSVKEMVSLSPYTTFKVGGPVDLFFEPENIWELARVCTFLEEEGIPKFLLGGGSNLLVRDGGVRGACLSLRKLRGFEVLGDELWVEAGLSLKSLLDLCVQYGLSGLEFLSGVPATVGGAVAMNAGAFGFEIKDFLTQVTLLGQGHFVTKARDALAFSYRGLGLPEGAVVVAARFKLVRRTPQEVREKISFYLKERRRRQPLSFPSAGCVFKNPGQVAAGYLIEAAGLKGFSRGGAQISRKHANFIINRGKARADDILFLVDLVKEEVFRQFGLELEEEIKIVGEA